MNRTWVLLVLLTTGVAFADDPPAKPAPAPAKRPADPAAPAKKAAAPAKKSATAAKKEAAPAKQDAEPAKTPAEPAKTEAQPQKDEAEAAATPGEAKSKHDSDLGMSILGNQEAPKSLVIVPWKSSEIGQSLGISTLLDDSRQPIDKEVFMRVLSYYDLMSTTTTKGRKP